MIQKILAVLLVAALLAAPAAALQAGHYTKGSDEQIDYTLAQYNDFKRIYCDDDCRNALIHITANGTELYLSRCRFAFDATHSWLGIWNSKYIIDCKNLIMYDTSWKYDIRANKVSKMTSDDLSLFAGVQKQLVMDICSAANKLGWDYNLRVIDVTTESDGDILISCY